MSNGTNGLRFWRGCSKCACDGGEKSCVQCTTVEQHVGLGLGDMRAVPGCTDTGPLRFRHTVLPQALAFAVRSLCSRTVQQVV